MGCGGEMGCLYFQTMVTGERKEVGGRGVCECVSVCNSHRQDPSNKARSVLLQIQRE